MKALNRKFAAAENWDGVPPAAAAPFMVGSPAHTLQNRLETAVFDSFSNKESSGIAATQANWRTAAIILGASLGGWGIFIAGTMLRLY